MSGGVDITIRGPWLHTIPFEVPVLAIVSEAYFAHTQPRPDEAEGLRRLSDKIAAVNAHPDPAFRISDFGTRRRFSTAWHRRVIGVLKLESLAPDVFQVTASCAEAAVKVLGVPFEIWSLALFALVGLVAAMVLRQEDARV